MNETRKIKVLLSQFIDLNDRMLLLTAKQTVVYRIIGALEDLVELVEEDKNLKELDEKMSNIVYKFNDSRQQYLSMPSIGNNISRDLKWAFYSLTRISEITSDILNDSAYEYLDFYHELNKMSKILRPYLASAVKL